MDLRELERNPVVAQEIAIADDPLMPSIVKMNHQMIILEHPEVVSIVPFQLGDALTGYDRLDSFWKGHCHLSFGRQDWRVRRSFTSHNYPLSVQNYIMNAGSVKWT